MPPSRNIPTVMNAQPGTVLSGMNRRTHTTHSAPMPLSREMTMPIREINRSGNVENPRIPSAASFSMVRSGYDEEPA